MYPCRLITTIGKQMQYTMLFDGRTTAASSGYGAGQLIKCIYTLYVRSVIVESKTHRCIQFHMEPTFVAVELLSINFICICIIQYVIDFELNKSHFFHDVSLLYFKRTGVGFIGFVLVRPLEIYKPRVRI